MINNVFPIKDISYNKQLHIKTQINTKHGAIFYTIFLHKGYIYGIVDTKNNTLIIKMVKVKAFHIQERTKNHPRELIQPYYEKANV